MGQPKGDALGGPASDVPGPPCLLAEAGEEDVQGVVLVELVADPKVLARARGCSDLLVEGEEVAQHAAEGLQLRRERVQEVAWCPPGIVHRDRQVRGLRRA